MPRVVCSLRNASHIINGVRFASLGDDGGMLSEEITDAAAAEFCAIRGYDLYTKPIDIRESHRSPGDEPKKTSAGRASAAASLKETT